MKRVIFSVVMAGVFGAGCATGTGTNPSSEDATARRSTASEPSALKVLMIGDSHTTGYATSEKRGPARSPGLRLSEHLIALRNTTVSTYGSCGSQTQSWINGVSTRCGFFERTSTSHFFSPKGSRTPKISKLLADEKPDLVVVALGANFLPADYSEKDIETYAAGFVRIIRDAGARCAWVGPPHAYRYGDLSADATQKKMQTIDRAIKAAVSDDCAYVSTLDFAKYPAGRGDGLHHRRLGKTGATLSGQWADRTMEELRRQVAQLEGR